MENYKDLYEKLKKDFEEIQELYEKNTKMLEEKNRRLEKRLDAVVNVVEISKYINSYISDHNLIPMINDIIIGILGVTYSSIHIKEKDTFICRATNMLNKECDLTSESYFYMVNEGKPFVLNCRMPIFSKIEGKSEIHSLIGVPIYLRNKFMGYIIVEHTHYDFFSYEHIKFISSIANQIGIALENNFLYNQIRESSIRDPLLKIYNRKYFFDAVENKISNDAKKSFAIVMIDIDDFKKVNDIYGHQFGDEALIDTVRLIQEGLSKDDFMARYGGEEIVAYLEINRNKEEVYRKIEDIRSKISSNIIQYNNKKSIVTASFGISFYPDNSGNVEELLNVADTMLYKSKESGKNKIVSS